MRAHRALLIVSLALLGSGALAVGDVPVSMTLKYDASAWAAARAWTDQHVPGWGMTPEEMVDFQLATATSKNSAASVSASASVTPTMEWVERQEWNEELQQLVFAGWDPVSGGTVANWASASASVTTTADGLLFSSSLDRCPTWPIEPGQKNRAGSSTRISGTLTMGTDDGYPEGTPLSIDVSTLIGGDPAWPTWQWYVKIYRGQTLLETLNGGNPEATLDVEAGETLKFEMFHVPEPATLAILGLGMAGLLLRRRR